MIIEFKVKNWMCFKDEVCLSMGAGGTQRHENRVFNLDSLDYSLLHVTAIYGANLSGKSCFIKAINFFRSVLVGFEGSKAYKDLFLPHASYFVDKIGEQPVEMSMKFLVDDKIYRIWLLLSIDGIQVGIVYKIDSNNNEHEIQLINGGDVFSLVYSFQTTQEGKDIINWFKNNLNIIDLSTDFNYSVDYKRFSKILDNLELKELRVSNRDNAKIVLDNIRSHGAKRIFVLASHLESICSENKVLIIDDIDRGIHPVVLRNLIKSYLESFEDCVDHLKSQIIFTTHEIRFLKNNFLRRDEVWFLERYHGNFSGDLSGDLFSLNDFETLDDESDIDDEYMAGRLGGSPEIFFSNSLNIS
jgi:AAA15 family ATPase/GTPase